RHDRERCRGRRRSRDVPRGEGGARGTRSHAHARRPEDDAARASLRRRRRRGEGVPSRETRGRRARRDRGRAPLRRSGHRLRQDARAQPRAPSEPRRTARARTPGARGAVPQAVHRHAPPAARDRASRGNGRRRRLVRREGRARRPGARRAPDPPGARRRGRDRAVGRRVGIGRPTEHKRVSELELHRAPVSVGEIAYVDAGDPESPAVVFLHGFPTSSYLWRELVPLFAPWMRAIAPDLLGCGDSSKPGNASLEPHAQAGHLRELLASLGVERFAVVGHAEGGGIAQILALEGGVEALVLIDTIALDARSPMLAAAAASGGESPASRADARKAITAFLDRAVARTERPVDELRMEYLRPFSGPDGARAFDRLMRGARAGALPTAEDLSRI